MKLLSMILVMVGFNLFGFANQIEEAVFDGETLAGTVEYKGGFAKLSLDVTTKEVVKSFRLAIPKFCKDVEVLEAGTVTETVYDPSELLEEKGQLYSVNSGAGSRISGIQVTLNGPKTSECTIPIFLNTSAMAPAHQAQIELNVCNLSGQQAWITLGYFQGSVPHAKGWWTLRNGECQWLAVDGDAAKGLFLHGKTLTGGFWGMGPQNFCVKDTEFEGPATTCQTTGGHVVPFSKLNTTWPDGKYRLNLR